MALIAAWSISSSQMVSQLPGVPCRFLSSSTRSIHSHLPFHRCNQWLWLPFAASMNSASAQFGPRVQYPPQTATGYVNTLPRGQLSIVCNACASIGSKADSPSQPNAPSSNMPVPSVSSTSFLAYHRHHSAPGQIVLEEVPVPWMPPAVERTPRDHVGSDAIRLASEVRRRRPDAETFSCTRPGCTSTFTRKHNLRSESSSPLPALNTLKFAR
jgi:hypothetical protein